MAVASVTINAVDNMSATLGALQQSLNALQQQANNIKIGGNNNANLTPQLNEATAAARRLSATFSSIGSIILNQVVSALKSAVTEIKNMDDQLVVVRRVTGKTSEQLAGMSANAHKVAQQYGVAASDFLSGVANFTRAGYGDQAESLAELSVKLQRAGDVSASVAQQYMTAVDKAYAMQGSVEALSAAMDGANQIGNEYATNVGEIAAGIGKVATIAATGHVGIDELTAALGTITAVTQRSGTEAATALRAIFLNIMGDTKTEIEEGATWTAGEIEGLSDVLRIYAPDVVAAAEATQTLIDPMEAIGALAKSFQQGVLTESKLFSMVSDIGGKLRTNQLMVLIKNWDMYESMLKTYANASGSIDKEIGNSMDSITVKINQLKAAWTAMVNDTLSSNLIKGFLDVLINCVQAAGNLQTALGLVLGVVVALKSQKIATIFADLFAAGSASVAASLTTTIARIGTAVAAVSAAIILVNRLIQNYKAEVAAANDAAIKQSNSAVTSSNELTKLYGVYATATAGSREYETALRALAEALGLTSEEAAKSASSIKDLTLDQMKQAAANAKTAMEQWSGTQQKNWAVYIDQFKSWASDFVSDLMNGELGEGSIIKAFSQYFSSNAQRSSVTDIIEQYEAVQEARDRLSREAYETGRDVTKDAGMTALTNFLTQTKSLYDQAITLLNNYATTEANVAMLSMANYEKIVSTQKAITDGKEEALNADEVQEYADAMYKLAESYKDGTTLGEKMYETVLKQFAQSFPDIIKLSKEYQDYMSRTGGGSATAKDAEQATSAVKTLASALSEATKAKTAFDEAMSNKVAENAGFKDYQSAYASYAAEISAGRVNSQTAMLAAQYLMAGSGKYNFNDLYANGGYAAVNSAMKNGPWATMYGTSTQEYGEGFLTMLGKMANKAGEIMDAAGEKVIATYSKTGNKIKFTIDDMQALSEVSGLSLHQIYQAVTALGVYGETGSGEIQDQINGLKELCAAAGVTTDATGKLSVNYGELLSYMRENGGTEESWQSTKQWLDLLNEIGAIELTNVPDVEEGWQNYNDFVEQSAEGAEENAQAMQDVADASQQAASAQEDAAAAVQEGADAVADATNAHMEAINAADEARAAAAEAKKSAEELYAQYSQLASELNEIAHGDYTLIFDAKTGESYATTVRKVETDTGEIERTYYLYFDADGKLANQKIIEIETLADGTERQRTIVYDAHGNMQSFYEIERDANETGTERLITYYANGNQETFNEVTTMADGTKVDRTIKFYADGQVQSFDVVQTAADGAARERHINFYADGKAASFIAVDTTADGVSTSRQIDFTANGDVASFHSVTTMADDLTTITRQIDFAANGFPETFTSVKTMADGTAETRVIHFDANMNYQSVETIRVAANGVAVARKIDYYTDGVLTGIEIINENADSPTKVTRRISYYADGNISDLKIVNENADSATKTVRTFHYGADGKILDLELVETNAEGVTTKKTYQFHYGANGEPLYADVKVIETYLDGTTSDPYSYTITGDDDELYEAISEAQKAISDSVESDWGEYPLDADNEVDEVVAEAEETISNSLKNTATQYVLTAVWNEVKDAVTNAINELKKVPREIKIAFLSDIGDFIDSAEDLITILNPFSSQADKQSALFSMVRRYAENQMAENANSGSEGTDSGSGEVITLPVEADEEDAAEAGAEAAESAQEEADEDPLSFEVEDDPEGSADAGRKAAEDAQGGADENPVDIPVEADSGEAAEAGAEAAADAQAAVDEKPLEFHAIPSTKGLQSTVADSQVFPAAGYGIYRIVYQTENEGETLEVIDEINEATQSEHKVTIYTEADGTQTIEELFSELDENGNRVEKKYTTTIDADGNAITTMESAEALAASLERVYHMTLASNADATATKIDNVRQKLNKLNGKTITVKIKTEQSGNIPDVPENAKGTDYFAGGPSMLNEEGAELVVSGGRATIYGKGKPTIAAVPKGARIYTAEETARILHGVSGMSFPAYAKGNQVEGEVTVPAGNGNDNSNSNGNDNNNLLSNGSDNNGNNNNNTGSGGDGNNSSSSSEDKDKFWDTIKEYLDYGLKKIEYAIKDYESKITILERARDKLLDPIETEIKDIEYSVSMLQYEVTLLERARDAALKPLDEEIERLKKARTISQEDEALEEKKLAVEQARADLMDAMHQRTVRFFNEETGQWEWMADHKSIDSAKEALESAEEAYADAQEQYEITLLERERERINNEYQDRIDELQDQEDVLEDQKEDLENEKTKINYEYEVATRPLQEQMDALQDQYDDLELFYNRLVDAVDVPTESLTAALTEMSHAAANYTDQLENTVALPNTLYELAPGWSAVEMGDLGQYTAHNNTYGDYSTTSNTNVYVNGINLSGQDSNTVNAILNKYGLYK